MSKREAAVLRAAEAWAVARAKVEGITKRKPRSTDRSGSAELAIHSAAERIEELRAAEQALYETITARN